MKTMTADVDGTMKKGLGIGIYSCGDDVGYFHTGRNFGLHHSLGLVFERAKLAISVMARGKGSRGFPSELATLATNASLPMK